MGDAAEERPVIVVGPGRPADGKYPKLEDGTRPESITEILRWWGDPSGLIGWACGLTYKAMQDGASKWVAIKRHEAVRDAAGDHGSAAHNAIQAWEAGADVGPHVDAAPDPIAVIDALCRWKAWRADEGAPLRITHIEVPIASERLRVAGTPDFIGRWHGELVVGDLKTGRSLRSKVQLQMGAYAIGWHERTGEMPTGGLAIHVPSTGDPVRCVNTGGAIFAGDCEDAARICALYHNDVARKKRHKLR